MATEEAKEYYYEKAKKDFRIGFYDQPFPSATVIELDEFEIVCNKMYKTGYGDAVDEFRYSSKSFF